MLSKSILISAIALNTFAAFANTTLPYIGPQLMSCDVSTPTDESADIDSGYQTSEDCKTVYVLPPVEGVIKFGMVSPTWDVMFCPVIEGIEKSITKKMERKKNQEWSEEESRNISKEISALKRELDKFAGNQTVMQVAASAQLQWSRIQNAYEKANQGKSLTIRKMPIVAGIFSTGIYQIDNYDMESLTGGVNKLRVHGLGLPSDEDVTGTFSDMPFPEYLKKLAQPEDAINVFMNEGVGMDLLLNLKGACAFNKNSSYALAGTYTYFYPVQTKSMFQVIIDDAKLQNDIYQLIKAGNKSISTESLLGMVDKSKSVSISQNEGINPGQGDVEQLSKYKDDLVKIVLENILSVISSKRESVLDNASYIEDEKRSERRCKRRLFRHSSCHTTYYTVQVTKINWDSVRAQLDSLIGNQNAQADSYKTFYLMGTSAMLPVSSNNTRGGL